MCDNLPHDNLALRTQLNVFIKTELQHVADLPQCKICQMCHPTSLYSALKDGTTISNV